MHGIESFGRRLAHLVYAAACYAVFVSTLVYLAGFVSGLWRWIGLTGNMLHSLEQGSAGSTHAAVAVDLLLVGVFGLQHSIMAREGFKRRWIRLVSPAIERSTYVLASSICLAFVVSQWRPIGGPSLWNVTGTPLAAVLVALSGLGFVVALLATFAIDHLELFGLRQAWLAFRRQSSATPRFATPGPYRAVRHPIYLGFLLAFWAAPAMSLAHLVFAAAFTAYVLVGIRFEERDLLRVHGDRYRGYRRTTPMLVPWRWPRRPRPGSTDLRGGAPSPAPSSPAAPSTARTAS